MKTATVIRVTKTASVVNRKVTDVVDVRIVAENGDETVRTIIREHGEMQVGQKVSPDIASSPS